MLWLIKKWLPSRIEYSIKHEYDKEIEKYRYNFQIEMQKTSLFFEYRQKSFSFLIKFIADIQEEWLSRIRIAYDEYEPRNAPKMSLEKLEDAIIKNQLFLDQDCLLALNLLKDALSDGWADADPNEEYEIETYEPYERFVNISAFTFNLFQEKIGITGTNISKQIGLIGAISELNKFNADDFHIPDSIKIQEKDCNVNRYLLKAQENEKDLIKNLKDLLEYLKNKNRFDDHYERAMLCLKVLNI